MKKTNQFDDIKAGELIRFLKNPMRGNSPRNNWSFGIVAYRLKTAFCVYPVGRPYLHDDQRLWEPRKEGE